MQMQEMSDSEFSVFRDKSVANYATDMERCFGRLPGELSDTARANFKKLLPDGRLTKDNFFYHLKDVSGEMVGHLWYSIREQFGKKQAFICDIYVEPKFRGAGNAKIMMGWVEEQAREHGLKEVSLHVFGFNSNARGLYRSLGYEEFSVHMSKRLPEPE